MKDVFCTKEQKVTEHKASLSPDGEFVFTCQTEGCGRFIKFPADTENLDELLVTHEEVNTGQVSIEAQEKKLADFLKAKK
jgi:hypothetical protein